MHTPEADKVAIGQIMQKRPLIITGPCSAETRDQLVNTAKQIAATGKAHLLRAGIWKPRTRPGSFEGVGSVGLEWLQEARAITGLPTTVEVATARQVEDALRHEVDVLWIGARTTVNPFSIQEVADALKGVDIPVLIKNPVNPDIELWIGAVERIAASGISNIGLIHRGFSSFGNTIYRNAPMWHLAIEMRRRHPDMLMICDPSHICGRRDIIFDVAQKAIDLGYDGLMIETHITPDTAWSDSRQQITPDDLAGMLDAITWRQEAPDHELVSVLEALREKVDQIDDELMQLLGQRMSIADKIGSVKKENNIAILQARRWNEILERAYAKAESLGLSREFVTKYFDAVHLESIAHQTKVFHKK